MLSNVFFAGGQRFYSSKTLYHPDLQTQPRVDWAAKPFLKQLSSCECLLDLDRGKRCVNNT